MIPKIIHYCWLSGDEFPPLFKKCIQSWKEKLPGWKFQLWDSSCLKEIDEPWVHEAYQAKVYSHAADYIRLYAVYKYGGLYLECDVEVLKDFSPLLKLDYVIGLENSEWGGYIEAATFGATAGNPYILKCLNSYHDKHFLLEDGSYNYSFLIPQIMKQNINHFTILNDINEFDPKNNSLQLFPAQFFSPKNYNTEKFDKLTDETFSIHHFKGSWRPLKMRLNRFLWRHLGNKKARIVQNSYQTIKSIFKR